MVIGSRLSLLQGYEAIETAGWDRGLRGKAEMVEVRRKEGDVARRAIRSLVEGRRP